MRKFLAGFYAKLSKRERTVLFGASAVLLFLCADRFALGPVVGRVASLKDEIQSEEAAIKKSLHVLLRKEQIIADGQQLKAYSVDSSLPEEKEITSLLKDLEGIAQSSAVSVVYVKPGNTETGSGIKKFSANLECEAEMREIVGFFYAIESSASLYQIEKYEIQPKNRESSTARCTLTVTKTVLSW